MDTINMYILYFVIASRGLDSCIGFDPGSKSLRNDGCPQP